MSEISSLYSSTETIYRTGGKRRSSKELNGDVKHIVFKDGEPVYTEVIQTSKHLEDSVDAHKRDQRSGEGKVRRRISAPSRSSEEVVAEKRKKLAARLKTAMAKSETLWNDKSGIWISYQGNQQFLVKSYANGNKLLKKEMMSSSDIINSDIQGILDAGWKRI